MALISQPQQHKPSPEGDNELEQEMIKHQLHTFPPCSPTESSHLSPSLLLTQKDKDVLGLKIGIIKRLLNLSEQEEAGVLFTPLGAPSLVGKVGHKSTLLFSAGDVEKGNRDENGSKKNQPKTRQNAERPRRRNIPSDSFRPVPSLPATSETLLADLRSEMIPQGSEAYRAAPESGRQTKKG